MKNRLGTKVDGSEALHLQICADTDGKIVAS